MERLILLPIFALFLLSCNTEIGQEDTSSSDKTESMDVTEDQLQIAKNYQTEEDQKITDQISEYDVEDPLPSDNMKDQEIEDTNLFTKIIWG